MGVFDRWHCEAKEAWQPLPSWCSGYIALGQCMARHNQNGTRLVTGLAAPTRAYAAAFTATGYVLARAALAIAQVDCAEHFQKLCNLPPQTPVTYQENNRILKAIFEGCEEHDGKRYIVIRVNREHARRKVPASLAANIQISEKQFVNLPKHQIGTALNDVPLLSACKVNFDIGEFCRHSRLEATMIGNRKMLLHELNAPLAAKADNGEFRIGTLQEVLRIKGRVAAGLGYRANLRSDREAKVKPDASEIPSLVIFDGAAGFLKWRDAWRGSHWIIILDKTEPRFKEAVDTLNQEYLNNRLEDTPLSLPELPAGVDVLAYEEERQ